MKKFFTRSGVSCLTAMLLAIAVHAQTTATDTTEFKPSGKLWGYTFGDFAYKGSADTIGGGRGGSNQYTKVPANQNMFQWRRIYLGYNYDISRKFSAEFLLAAEDDFATGVLGQGNGDILADNKFSPYIKLANLRWKGIYKGADLVVGQMNTPAFAKSGRNAQTAEEVWGYRSIERTITDVRRTPSFDMGAGIQATLPNNDNFGYNIMVGNGQSARPENDMFKAFYGDIWAKFMDKKIIVDLYQDYQKLNWNMPVVGSATGFHHDRNMTKLFVAYNTAPFTVGVEAFQNILMNDVKVTGGDGKTYFRTTQAIGVSVFTRGTIKKDKLGFFARYDYYNPGGKINDITDMNGIKSYAALTSQYDPTTKESFATFGLDFTPFKNVHFMPNVWVNTYDCTLPGSKYSLNPAGSPQKGTDAIYRITFYYRYNN